ncbi:restriction endonuclease [Elizabethkingia anophelis]|nr:restriction endonuclease [Elizabethkingia anophelis]
MNSILLKDIAISQTGPFGSQLHESDYVEKGTPIVTVEHLGETSFTHQNLPFVSDYDRDRLSKYSLKKGDIVFSRVGSIDRSTYVSEKEEGWLFSGRCIRVRIDENKADSRFISFYFRQKNFKLMMLNISVGATMPSLNTTLMDNIPLRLPNLITQKNIASVLSVLDDKIELNNNINIELEQMVKTLYDYWFVQFDFPNEDGKPYKSSGGKMVYNEVLKREIPKKWEVSVFNNWIENTKTGDWGKDKIEGNYTERVYCVRGADINGLNGKGEIKAPERFILKNNLSKKLQPNDFIIEISGGSPTQSTARIALLTEESFERFDTNVVCSNFCKAITLKDETYAYNFQQEWQRLYDAGVFFGYEGKTSGIKNFLFESFMDSYFVVEPPKELVLKFNSFAKEIEKKRQVNLKQNQELASLRDWLLPMLMNGQVKVAD